MAPSQAPPPNLGDDSNDTEALREKEKEALREKEKEEGRNLEMQEVEKRRRALLDQDTALAKQEEIVNQNWEVPRTQRQKLSQGAYDLEQGVKRRVDLGKSPSQEGGGGAIRETQKRKKSRSESPQKTPQI